MSARLIELKRLAQSQRDSETALAQISLGDHLFEVKGNGSNPYAYVLQGDHHRISVAKLGAKLVPLAYCRISSELLTTLGPRSCIASLCEMVGMLGEQETEPSVSRVDLCADFTTSWPLSHINEREFVTRARSFSRHTVARQFSGFSFSAGSPLSARLYNKSLEMASRKHPRPDLEEIWYANGWDGNQDVWRLEFQLRREALRGFEIVSAVDLLKHLSGLWEYSTRTWLRHTIPSESDTTQSRWPTASWWESLQEAFWGDFDRQTLTRAHLEPGRVPSDEFLYINGLSTLTSYSAREAIPDPEDAAQCYLLAARKFHDAREKETGVDFDNYYRQKVDNKRRLFNTALNQPLGESEHPGDKAEKRDLQRRAKAYRRGKDGY